MFVYNFKLSRTKIFKGILAIMAIICISLAGVGIFKIYNSNTEMELMGRHLYAFKRNRQFN